MPYNIEKMVLHNALLQTRAEITHLLILTAVLNFPQRSIVSEVIPIFCHICDGFWKHIVHT